MKKQNKKRQNAIDEKLKTKSLMFFVSFFSCDLQDFKMWTGKHLAQASCTELTLNHTEWHVDFQEQLYFNIIFSDVQPHESRLLSFRGGFGFQ